ELGLERQPAVNAVAEYVPVVSIANGARLRALATVLAAADGDARAVVAEAHAHGVLGVALLEDEIVVRFCVELPPVDVMPRREGISGRRRQALRFGLFVRQLGKGRRGEEWIEIDRGSQFRAVALDQPGVEIGRAEGAAGRELAQELDVGGHAGDL